MKNLETEEVEHSKPRERETQIMVGEPIKEEMNSLRDRKIDKCLSPSNRYRTWLININFFYLESRWISLKEIGEALKEARENIGITIEEAANDLKLQPSQIEDIESGNKDAFKDVNNLKYFVKDYAKYLGLDYEELIDDFNEYLFDYTSRLSLDDIKKARKKVENSKKIEEKKVVSPYTYEKPKKFSMLKLVFIIVLLLTIIISSVVIINNNKNNNKDDEKVENIIGG